ncbi:MAG: hypothetical protein KME19_06180 [Microcoleus vaginatus WJT46-NPBG5]|nr:hypothetical protein [Microcoleus vaginatus WJT46-NPBG5]
MPLLVLGMFNSAGSHSSHRGRNRRTPKYKPMTTASTEKVKINDGAGSFSSSDFSDFSSTFSSAG